MSKIGNNFAIERQ